jgi:hypothetical protein
LPSDLSARLAAFRRFLRASGTAPGNADEALEVAGELALVREGGAQGDLRQGEVASGLQEVLGPFDAAGDDALESESGALFA